jgi:hypothetical protein
MLDRHKLSRFRGVSARGLSEAQIGEMIRVALSLTPLWENALGKDWSASDDPGPGAGVVCPDVNILIVKLSALGDVTHTLPALTTLRRAHPTARIAWLVEATAAPLVLDHPALDQVLVWPRRQFTGALRSGRWFHALRLLYDFVRELRSVRYDLVLDFQALLKSAVWVALARGGRKVGFGRGMARSEGSHLFLNERVPAVSMEIHALDRGLMLLEAIGIRAGRWSMTCRSRRRRDTGPTICSVPPESIWINGMSSCIL